jgi:hypothetical protein
VTVTHGTLELAVVESVGVLLLALIVKLEAVELAPAPMSVIVGPSTPVALPVAAGPETVTPPSEVGTLPSAPPSVVKTLANWRA